MEYTVLTNTIILRALTLSILFNTSFELLRRLVI